MQRISRLLFLLALFSSFFVQDISAVEAQNQPAASAQGSRCTTNGETLFLRFNYQPTTNPADGYLANKAIIYIPKEAQCTGSFPMYIHLHGDNKYYDDISAYYLQSPRTASPVRTGQVAHYRTRNDDGSTTEHAVNGTNKFQEAIELAMRNARIPGMIFVLPVKAKPSVDWTNLNAQEIKRLVQEKLNSDPQTSNLRISLNNDLLLSGHSGAGCDGDRSGLLQFANANPKAVGVLDTCTSVYRAVNTTYPNALQLFYAADMAYTGATWSNGNEAGGYHNALPSGFQDLAQCDRQTFIGAPTTPQRTPGSGHYGTAPEENVRSNMSDEQKAALRQRNSHFREYWDTPRLPCAKHPAHPWYAVFATSVDHASAVGTGLRTLLNLAYSNNTPEPTTNTQPAPAQNNQPANNATPPQTNVQPNQVRQTAPLVSGSVPLEVSINGINSITGNNQGYIVNYTRIIFLYIAGLAGVLALLILIVAGILIIISGSQEKTTQAKQLIIGSLSGLALLATSGWILYLINPCFFTFGATPACTPRGTQAVHYNFSPDTTTPQQNPVAVNNSGVAPAAPTQNCANGSCDIVLPVPYLSQGRAPRECEYAGICATNPTAGLDIHGENRKWAGVTCGAASFVSAYLYVSGNTTDSQVFLRNFINDYYRCGIHNLPPGRSASIRGYDATNAPRTADDPLCAYRLGIGGDPNTMVRILKTQLRANGTHSMQLSAQNIFRELSAGHPIVIGGVKKTATPGIFEAHPHFTVIIGMHGYNQAANSFTDLVIHDVGYGAGAIMNYQSFQSLHSTGHLRSGIAVAM